MSSHDFSQRLLNWFEQHGRKDLPWQNNPTPYRVWVSEIMLQQTQVATVTPYFERFMAHFPDILSLANTDQDTILHLWTGLGYYARGRNLHKAAKQVRNQYDGQFPLQIDQLIELPGIGRSTAAAILSLSQGQSHAILDGNVKRVLTRHYAIDGWPGSAKIEKQLWQLAEQLTPDTDNDRYTQAIMDLGATLCRRSKPLCGSCPMTRSCLANQQQRQKEFPTPRPKKTIPVRYTNMLLITNPQGQVLLQQRPSTGIWGGLWSFPEITKKEINEQDAQQWCQEQFQTDLLQQQCWPKFRHTFSHYHLEISPIHLQLKSMPSKAAENNDHWGKPSDPIQFGLASPVKKLLVRLAIELKQS